MDMHSTATRSERASNFIVILAFGVLITGCDATDTLQNYYGPLPAAGIFPRSDQVLPTFDQVDFTTGFYRFRIRPDGIMDDGTWNPNPTEPDSLIHTLFSGGLWMGGVQGGRTRANLTWVGAPTSNFEPTYWRDQNASIYYFERADVSGLPANWPDSLGAQLSSLGSPMMYGDLEAIVPTITSSIPGRTFYESGFDSVKVVQTVFGYYYFRRINAYFVRYDLRNKSSSDITDLRLGIHTDTDLEFVRKHECSQWVSYGSNGTGFDLERKMTYTYPTRKYETMPARCQGIATGYLILETSFENGTSVDVGSHRIYRRNTGREREFSESAFSSFEQIYFALEGLSTTGQPMINPATGQETKWAFTGNPVDSTGWLDYPNDVRSLLSTEAFDLKADERISMTVVWITTRGRTLDAALSFMKETADFFQSRPGIWSKR
ncbi:MAG: hypothetical protein BMS9Abin05_0648 [Rhodothermia bacterium]|nr:MAG: hypothetical protein BMS9Abin05_0648 [Rhodothermia bacterium]